MSNNTHVPSGESFFQIEGTLARGRGAGLEDNPFNRGTDQFGWWQQGWMQGHEGPAAEAIEEGAPLAA